MSDATAPGPNAVRTDKPARADARRNLDALIEAARQVFAAEGIDAPVRTIAAKAGVGIGTFYRHFPERSELIKAIIRHEVDARVASAVAFAETHAPGDAVAAWMEGLVELAAAKRGLGPALHSGDPAYRALPDYVLGRLVPALISLLGQAVQTGEIRNDVDPVELVLATLRLADPASAGDATQARRMIALLADGLRRRVA